MTVSRELKVKLASAIRNAKIHTVIDMDIIKNDEEAILLISLLKAYGNSPGFLYHSPGRARSQERPPDAVLCHPDIGLLVIDAKSHPITEIEGVEAGSIFVRYQGRIQPKNVVQQVENQMFEIRGDALRIIRDERLLPLTNAMVAFPNIYESDWVAAGYDRCHPTLTILFKDQLETQNRLKQRVGRLVEDTQKKSKKEKPLISDQVELLYKVFGNSSIINEKRRGVRNDLRENSIGCYIDEMVALDKYLSKEQQELSRMSFDDSPRLIRGVAGSGKSVVLANIAGRYLIRRLDSIENLLFPEERPSIAVVCFNRALVDFLKLKIRYAFREQTLNEDIPSDVLLVKSLNGLMYSLARERGWPIEYIPIGNQESPDGVERANQYREQIRQFEAENNNLYNSLCFDAIFVDEGQDLESEDFKLLLDLIRPNEVSGEKPIMIFYDDAQNVYGRSRPTWRDVGINVVGERSYVMRECFRNTRQIVELAFNVLLGSQSQPSERVRTRTYADINYLQERGVIEEAGDHIRVKFAEREGNKPIIEEFNNREEEVNWLAEELTRLIVDEDVRTEDVLVLMNSPENFNFEMLKEKIVEKIDGLEFIEPFGSNKKDKDRYIFQAGKLTISTIHGAKGYDAPIVFLAGIDMIRTDKEGRAAFYVAATRAKMFLYLSGITQQYSLLEEARKVWYLL